ncbi:MAG: TorD/DmsD family molecular chaperone [Candidatus Methylomirabilales bacterium]
MIGDREISAFRRGYYGLLSRAYLDEPDGSFLQVLRDGVEARIEAADKLSPRLAEGWSTIRSCLLHDTVKLGEILSDEYNLLFVSPTETTIFPYESWYMEKEPYGPSLAAVRGFLGRIGLETRDSFTEPEDHISCELEIMVKLIARQEAAAERAEEERWLELQGEFFKTHLLTWIFLLCQDLEQQEAANFYGGIAKLTRGFMELEREVLAEWGAAVPRREPLGARDERWKGPTFDLLQIGRKGPETGEAEDSEQQGPGCS